MHARAIPNSATQYSLAYLIVPKHAYLNFTQLSIQCSIIGPIKIIYGSELVSRTVGLQKGGSNPPKSPGKSHPACNRVINQTEPYQKPMEQSQLFRPCFKNSKTE